MKHATISTAFALLAGSALAQSTPPVYVKLASIDAGRLVAVDSAEARRAKAALERADARCLAPNGIHNQVSHVRNELLERKLATSSVELLEGLAGVLSGADRKADCAKLLGMYATVRMNPQPEMQTHTDAVMGMRALAKAGAFGVNISERSLRMAKP